MGVVKKVLAVQAQVVQEVEAMVLQLMVTEQQELLTQVAVVAVAQMVLQFMAEQAVQA